MSAIAEIAMLVNDDFDKPLNRQIFDEFICVATDDVVEFLGEKVITSYNDYTQIGSFKPLRTGVLRLSIIGDDLPTANFPIVRCTNGDGEVLKSLTITEANKKYSVDINVVAGNYYYVEATRKSTSYTYPIIEVSLCGAIRFGRVV